MFSVYIWPCKNNEFLTFTETAKFNVLFLNVIKQFYYMG